MGSAHILVLGFLGAHNPYTPIYRILVKNSKKAGIKAGRGGDLARDRRPRVKWG